jgi:flagellar biosynthesis chaperone FliJ
MIFELQTVLDLRRDAENNAKRALELAGARLLSEEAEQGRLTERAQAARATLTAEIRRMGQGPAASTAEQGLARESYLRRLRDDVSRLRSAASEHAASALASARAAHEEALRSYAAALRDREAVSKLEERARESAQRTAARRADDEAMDLANARRR